MQVDYELPRVSSMPNNQRRRLENLHGLPPEIWVNESIYDWTILGPPTTFTLRKFFGPPVPLKEVSLPFQLVVHEKHRGVPYRPPEDALKPTPDSFRSLL